MVQHSSVRQKLSTLEENLRNKNYSENQFDLQNLDNLKNEDDTKNEDDPKHEDDPKMKTTPKMETITRMMMTPIMKKILKQAEAEVVPSSSSVKVQLKLS